MVPRSWLGPGRRREQGVSPLYLLPHSILWLRSVLPVAAQGTSPASKEPAKVQAKNLCDMQAKNMLTELQTTEGSAVRVILIQR